MSSLPGIDDPYWYEWYVGLDNIIKMLNKDNGIEYVIFQSSTHETIDDIIVGKTDNIELCYQVKHARTKKSITFLSLIEKDKSDKSLLEAISIGWHKCENNTIPILYSNKPFGSRKTTRISKITGNTYNCLSLEKFILKINCIIKDCENIEDINIEDDDLKEQWLEFINEIKIDNKIEFLKKIKFELSQPNLEESERIILNSIKNNFKCHDIMAQKIFNLIVSQLRIWTTTRRTEEKITRESVLNILCKQNEKKYDDILPPMPFFETRKSFCESLFEKLVNTNKKVIFLSGGPGSGKTSSVSYLNYHFKENFIARFYAFKPISLKDKVYNFDSTNTEPRNLWETLLNQIRNRFTGNLEKYNVPIINELCETETLRAEVIRLSRILYEITGKKSIICIDGIDHAARSENENNFLAQLYSPDEIPEGVVILLVGQFKNLYSKYPIWIKNSNSDVEELFIPKLSIEDVIQLIDTSNIKWIKSNIKKRIAQIIIDRTDGNNLSIIYILKEAERCANANDFMNLLERKSVSNDIEEYYEIIWKHAEEELGKKIKQNFWLDKIASMIVLANGPVNCVTMCAALDADLDDMIATMDMLYPLMIEEENNIYAIMHNDLRVYLTKTVKNRNSIYINTANKIAEYYLKSKEETFNRTHNMIPLMIVADKIEEISNIFNVAFVVESLAENVPINEIKSYSLIALEEACKKHNLKLVKIISEGIDTLSQYKKYAEHYNYNLIESFDIEKTSILELETVELNKNNLRAYYNALIFAKKVYNKNPLRAENILKLWYGDYTPLKFLKKTLKEDNLYSNSELYENIIKLWAGLSYQFNLENFNEIPNLNEDSDDIKRKIVSLCMLYNESYMKSLIDNMEYDKWINVFKCGVSVEFAIEEMIKITELNIKSNKIVRFLKKLSALGTNKLVTLLSILNVIITSNVLDEEVINCYKNIELKNKNYYDDEDIMIISLWIIIGFRMTDRFDRDFLNKKYADLLKDINYEKNKMQLLSIFNLSEIIGICIYNSHNSKKITYNKSDLKEVINAFFENKYSNSSYNSKKTTDLILILLTNLINNIDAENEFLEIVSQLLCSNKRIADYSKKILLEYLIKINRLDLVKEYIALLYGDHGENLFAMSDARSIHNNFKKYVTIVDNKLEKEISEKLKWDVVKYTDYKEYALDSLLKDFNDIANIDANNWKEEGIELYKISKIAYDLGSSLSESEVHINLIKQASKLGILNLWNAMSLNFDIVEKLDYVYELILELIDLYNEEDDLKLLWIFSIGILSFYNKDDQEGIFNVREKIKNKCVEFKYNELIVFMEKYTNFYWTINNINSSPSQIAIENNKECIEWNTFTVDEIKEILKEYVSDDYDKWRQVDSALKYLEQNNMIDKDIVNCILETFYKIGYKYNMEHSYLDDIFNSIIKYMSEEDYWNVINKIVQIYKEQSDEYAEDTCSKNLNLFIRKILVKSNDVERMKEYFSISIDKHLNWITGVEHIKVKDVLIINDEHYLGNPKTLIELIINILMIQLGSRNIHRMEIAFKSLSLLCLTDEEAVNIITKNWNKFNKIQKEQLYLLAERLSFEKDEKYSAFFEKIKDDFEVSNTINNKLQLMYILNKLKIIEIPQINDKKYKKEEIDYVESYIINMKFNYICHEIDIRHYMKNANLLLNDNCIDIKKKILSTYDSINNEDDQKIESRIGDSWMPIYINTDKAERIFFEEYKKGRWQEFSFFKILQTFERNDDGCFMSYYPLNITNPDLWQDEKEIGEMLDKGQIDDINEKILLKINDGIDTNNELCIGASLYIPINFRNGLDIIYSKNIDENNNRKENFYSIMPSYKVLYSEENELFETDVNVKSLCNKICGLTYGVNSNLRIMLSNVFVKKAGLKMKSINPLVFSDNNNRQVRFEWCIYPYRDKIHESYVRYQTMYRWVCNIDLFNDLLKNSNIKIIDNIDIQNSQI